MNDKQLTGNLAALGGNRRSFVKKLGIAGAVLGAVAESNVAKGQSTTSTGYTDFDIVNFALNLEYLEAEFYTVATTGSYIDSLGIPITGPIGTPGATTGGALVTFTDPQVAAIALELASDEREHVLLLQEAVTSLGGQYVAKPAINLDALGIGFGSQAEFLTLARAFEDIGVTAYAGGATLIVNSAVLGYAARILAVEALHSGSIRNAVDRLGVVVTALDPADIVPPPAGTLFFPTNNQALVELRTPPQVHYIAYGGVANATSGGFFPAGTNNGYQPFTVASATPATYDGSTITGSPNPITSTPGVAGQTTITWSAPSATIIEIHIGSPDGVLFTHNVNAGSMQTGAWVTNGLTFYLQDVSVGQALTSTYTLATFTATVTTSS